MEGMVPSYYSNNCQYGLIANAFVNCNLNAKTKTYVNIFQTVNIKFIAF